MRAGLGQLVGWVGWPAWLAGWWLFRFRLCLGGARAVPSPCARVPRGLRTKLAVDGVVEVSLNCHTMTKKPNRSSGLERYDVKAVATKFWVATVKRKSPEEEQQWTWTNALGALHDLTNIPNENVRIIFHADLQLQPNPVIRLTTPALIWARSIDFHENDIVRFA